jgi:DNA-binding CsgD family transcriptional regulator
MTRFPPGSTGTGTWPADAATRTSSRAWPRTRGRCRARSRALARFGSWEAAIGAAGYTARHATYGPNPDARAQTAALYASGLSIAAIAERLGVDRKTVRERLDRAGIPRRPPAPSAADIPDEHEQMILEALNAGATTGEVAERLAVSRHAVELVRARHSARGGRVMRYVRVALCEQPVELTRRQRQVVELVVDQRLSSTQAARRLGLARSTVDMHLKAVADRIEHARAHAPERARAPEHLSSRAPTPRGPQGQDPCQEAPPRGGDAR